MNTTLVALHVSSLLSQSPFMQPAWSNSRVKFSNTRFQRTISPILSLHIPRFSAVLTASIFKQTGSVVDAKYEHDDLKSRKLLDSPTITFYDCWISANTKNVRGGAVCVVNPDTELSFERVTFESCNSGKYGGAIFAEAYEAKFKFTKFVDCSATEKGNSVKSVAKITSIDSSTCYSTDFKEIGESSFDVECPDVTLKNLNVSLQNCVGSHGIGLFTNKKICNIAFCTFASSHALSDIINIGINDPNVDPTVRFEYSNIYNNTVDTDGSIIAIGCDSVTFVAVAFSKSSDCYYINLMNSDSSAMMYACACDVDTARAVTTTSGASFDPRDSNFGAPKVTLCNLWVGGDLDYSRMPDDASETYVATITKSLWIENNKVVNGEAVTYMRKWSGLDVSEAPEEHSDNDDDEHEGLSSVIYVFVAIMVLLIVGLGVHMLIKRFGGEIKMPNIGFSPKPRNMFSMNDMDDHKLII